MISGTKEKHSVHFDLHPLTKSSPRKFRRDTLSPERIWICMQSLNEQRRRSYGLRNLIWIQSRYIDKGMEIIDRGPD